MRLQIQKQHIPDRITVVQKIIFCATSSSSWQHWWKSFPALTELKEAKKPHQIMSVANLKERIPRKKRIPALVSPSVSTMGTSLFIQIIVCYSPPCTTQTVLLLIPQGKTSSYCWLMLLVPQHQMYLILFCFKVSFIHKSVDIIFYFHYIYYFYTPFVFLNHTNFFQLCQLPYCLVCYLSYSVITASNGH